MNWLQCRSPKHVEGWTTVKYMGEIIRVIIARAVGRVSVAFFSPKVLYFWRVLGGFHRLSNEDEDLTWYKFDSITSSEDI